MDFRVAAEVLRAHSAGSGLLSLNRRAGPARAPRRHAAGSATVRLTRAVYWGLGLHQIAHGGHAVYDEGRGHTVSLTSAEARAWVAPRPHERPLQEPRHQDSDEPAWRAALWVPLPWECVLPCVPYSLPMFTSALALQCGATADVTPFLSSVGPSATSLNPRAAVGSPSTGAQERN